MACGYWDYDGTSSTTGGLSDYWNYQSGATTTTTGGTLYYDTCCSTPATIPRIRKILVKAPDEWSIEKNASFVKLVNKDTDTGWKITMVIQGEIAITDPNVEIREMDEFVPLLKVNATLEDQQKINDFFSI